MTAPPGRATVIGAGLAGLAAAVRLARRGVCVRLLESAGHAGGRCRSLFDPLLERTIDNGAHLIVGANGALFDFLHAVGYLALAGRPPALAAASMAAESKNQALVALPCRYPFVDLSDGTTWTLRPGAVALLDALLGRLPFPVSALRDGIAALERAPEAAVVRDILPDDAVFRRLWGPMTVSILNTPPERASARLLGRVLKATVGQGAMTSRPYAAPHGLGPALIEPAINALAELGAQIRFNARVTALTRDDTAVTALAVGGETLPLEPDERVIFAAPATVCATLLPEIETPDEFAPIVNAHFRVDGGLPAGTAPLTGVIGATAEWLFVRGDVVSATVSAATALAEAPSEEIASLLWADARRVLRLGGDRPCPPVRVIKEKRATITQSPAQLALRPRQATPWSNLVLAGDWTDGPHPCTIEAAVASGHRAADIILHDFLKK